MRSHQHGRHGRPLPQCLGVLPRVTADPPGWRRGSASVRSARLAPFYRPAVPGANAGPMSGVGAPRGHHVGKPHAAWRGAAGTEWTCLRSLSTNCTVLNWRNTRSIPVSRFPREVTRGMALACQKT